MKTKLTSLKLRISRNLREVCDVGLVMMARPPHGKWYRRKFFRDYGIPWCAGAEDYLKKLLLKELGRGAFLRG